MKFFYVIAFVFIIPTFALHAGEKGNGMGPLTVIGHDAGRRIEKLCPIFFEKPKDNETITVIVKGVQQTYSLSAVRHYCCEDVRLSVCDDDDR